MKAKKITLKGYAAGIAVITTAIAFIFILAYLQHSKKDRIKNETEQIMISVFDSMETSVFGISLNTVKRIAAEEAVVSAISGRARPELSRALYYMETVGKTIGVSIVYLMNEEGLVVVSSSYEGEDLTGNSYKFRPYFTEAFKGGAHVYPALGVTTKKRGIYFSAPVKNAATGKTEGVAVIKFDAEKLDNMLKGRGWFAYVVSPEGVIFISGKNELLFKAEHKLDDKAVESLRDSRQFADEKLEPVEWKKITEGRKIISTSLPFMVEGWEIKCAAYYDEFQSDIPPEDLMFAAGIGSVTALAGGLIIFLLFYFVRKQEQSEIEKQREIISLKAEFTYLITHELRSPLTAINGFVGMLFIQKEKLNLPNEQWDYIQRIKNNTSRLLKLVNELLDAAKMEAGAFEVKKAPADIVDIIKTSAWDMMSVASEKKITIEAPLEGCKLECAIDKERLSQVFVNLISNAVKFTPEGGKIFVSAMPLGSSGAAGLAPEGFQVKEGAEYILAEVRDSGEGMEAEELKMLFCKFYQTESSKKQKKGTGLGLIISKGIIEKHGGIIWAESQGKGCGTSFKFLLPK